MVALSRSLLRGSALAATLASAVAPAAMAAPASAMQGNVPRWVAAAADLGAAPSSATARIVVHMTVRDPAGLAALATAVATPGSASYGQFLTRDAFAQRFAPAPGDVDAVRSFLAAAGLHNVTAGPLGAYVSATGTVGELQTAFRVAQRMFRYRGLTLRGTASEPVLPAALASKVLFVEGLSETGLLRRPQHKSVTAADTLAAPAGASTASVLPPPVADNTPSPYCSTYFGDSTATLSTQPAPYKRKLPWLNCGYTPQQIQAAYGLNPLNVGLDGRGVTIAIVDAFASPTLMQDGNLYAAAHNLPPLTSSNFTQIIPAGIYDVSADNACGPYGWWTEQSLDVASVHGSAPGANIVYVGGEDCDTGLTTALYDTIYNRVADIVTNSYGDGGEAISAAEQASDDQAFEAGAAMGETLLFSSGDDGDLSQDNGVATGSWEATSAYVTGVGGTSLLLRSADGTKQEHGWGNYRDLLADATVNSATSITTSGLTTTSIDGTTYSDFAFYAGSGGGISLIETQPSYQAGVVPSALATTLNEGAGSTVPLTPRRVSPDISADADPYTGYLYGETYTIANDGHSDIGCVPETSTTEFCQIAEGGTSLASPLTAGVIATVDEVRGLTGRPFVGFANPWLYGLKIGKSLDSAGIGQVKPPAQPLAVLRGYVGEPNTVRVVTINSVPALAETSPFPLTVCGQTICEGLDDVFNYTTKGYNDVTGLGVPYLPLLALE